MAARTAAERVTAPASDFYTIEDLRVLLNVGRDQAYRIVTEEMRHLRIGRQFRVPKREYEAWVERQLIDPQLARPPFSAYKRK